MERKHGKSRTVPDIQVKSEIEKKKFKNRKAEMFRERTSEENYKE
jgi:hypothetical protein